jgi:hypothetical protein
MQERLSVLSDGKTHKYYHDWLWLPNVLISVALAIILHITIFSFDFWKSFLFLLSFFLHYLLGENIISPDLDQISVGSQDATLITYGKDFAEKFRKSNVFIKLFANIFGFVIGLPGVVLFGYSALYAYAISFVGGHRSFFSHFPVVGTVGRMIWESIPIVIVCFFWYSYGVSMWGWNGFWYYMYLDIWLLPVILGQFLGLNNSDLIHIYLDYKK